MIPSGQSYSWISRFAIEHVAARADLQNSEGFSPWTSGRKWERRLFQIGIANDLGGSGGGFKTAY